MKGLIYMDNTLTMKFANAIYNRRKQLGLTQEEVARRVGTSKQMVSRYELGQRSPKVIMADKFASALDTTLDSLMEESVRSWTTTEMMVGIPVLEETYGQAKTDEAKAIASIVDRLDQPQRRQILDIVYAMYPHFKEGE